MLASFRTRSTFARRRVKPPHPAVKADMLVNAGALKMALNVLRRAGKNEVAEDLEKTAQPAGEAEPVAVVCADFASWGYTTAT